MEISNRIDALKNAYEQLLEALMEKVDTSEVDPEKRKAAMSMYKLAQEDSRSIFDELIDLEGLALVDKEDAEKIELQNKIQGKKKGAGLSPESRTKTK